MIYSLIFEPLLSANQCGKLKPETQLLQMDTLHVLSIELEPKYFPMNSPRVTGCALTVILAISTDLVMLQLQMVRRHRLVNLNFLNYIFAVVKEYLFFNFADFRHYQGKMMAC